MTGASPASFESAKQRLAQIADSVSDENMSLDEALDLFEEAVSLGMQMGDLLEVGADQGDIEEQADEEAAADAAGSANAAGAMASANAEAPAVETPQQASPAQDVEN